MDKYGICNVCEKNFQPEIKNGKVVGMKYYCSDLCFDTPIFKSVCKYCNSEIFISGKELRQRRGKLPIVCLEEKCLSKSKEIRYSKINYKLGYRNSLKEKHCVKCNNIFIGGSLSLYCENCSYKMIHKICICCGKEFKLPRVDSNLQVCKDCIVGNEQRYVDYCDNKTYTNCKFNVNCSRYFYYGSPQNRHCIKQNKCIHEKDKLYCQECSQRTKVQLYNILMNNKHKIINGNLILKSIDIHDKNRRLYSRLCKTCDRSFKGFSPNSDWCGCCYYIRKCEGCGNLFATVNKDSLVCGQECSGIYFHKKGYDTHISELVREEKFLDKNIMKIDLKPYTEIIESNLNNFNGISGIWFKSSDNVVLDVCITKNIYKEIEYHYYAIKNKVNNKYSKMSNYSDIKFYYLESFDSWEEGLNKEFQFAIKTYAKYWSPAPGIQMTLFSKLNK